MEHDVEGLDKSGNEDLGNATIDGNVGRRDEEILIKVAHGEERNVLIASGSNVTAILEIFATERGCTIEELVLVREGEEQPLSAVVVIDTDYPHRCRHHLHHAKAVKVIIFYQAGSDHREFRRNATVDEVLVWAIQAFNIDPGMATEFELARRGSKEELPGAEHIGHVARHHHELELDLIRGDIANGSEI
jgi:hypothetical protein